MTRSTCISVSRVALSIMIPAMVWGGIPARAETSSAASNWEAMTKCAAIADAVARHDCSDEVMRKAGLLGSAEARPSGAAASAGAAPARSQPDSGTQLAVQTPPGPEVRSDRRYASRPEEPRKFDLTLEKVVKRGDGKLVLSATDGSTWQQLYTDATVPVPSSGQLMSVKKNTLGGYMCRIGKWPPFRCAPNT